MKSLHDSIAESFDILLENISFKKPQGIATGYKHFDNMLRGIHKGNLTVIAAPPSPGKTALALNIVIIWQTGKWKTEYFSVQI